MKKNLFKLIGGGLASHIKGFKLIFRCLDAKMHGDKVCIKAARQLRSYAAKIFSYNHERGLNHELNNRLDCHATARNDEKCHTEDNSPKYRMVGNVCSSLRANAKQSSENCHSELNSGSINVDLSVGKKEPSPEFLSSSQLTKKFNPQHKVQTGSHASPQLCGSLCLTKREGNNFHDKDFSRFTSHFSLKSAAFTLAEVLITLGIIGIVAALTLPTLITNYQKSVVAGRVKKFYSTVNQAIKLSEADNGSYEYWDYPDSSSGDSEEYQKFVDKYLKKYFSDAVEWKTGREYGNTNLGIIANFPDGAYMKIEESWGANHLYLYYYPNYTKRESVRYFSFCFNDENSGCKSSVEPEVPINVWDGTREYLTNHWEGCSRGSDTLQLCAKLLQFDNWEFKADYPW